MTAPHIGNTGVNDEDPESRPDLGRRLRRARPRAAARNWRVPARARRRPASARASSASATSTPARSPGTCASAARCGSASSPGPTRRPPERATCWPRSLDCAARWPGRALAERGRRTDAAVRRRPRIGERRSTVAALDLGIKAMTPHLMAERGIEVHVLPATRRPIARRAHAARARRPGRGVLLQRPGRPGRPPSTQVALLREVLDERTPVLRHLLRQPAARARARVRHLQAHVRPPRHQPAGAWTGAPAGSRSPRTTTASRSTPRSSGAGPTTPRRRLRPGRGQPRRASTTTSSRGCECLDIPAFSVQYHPEAAAGPHDAAYLFDRFVDLMAAHARIAATADGLMPKRDDIQQRPGDRLRPDRHRPGLRVRLLRHPGLPGAARGGPAGHPGQLQPGDDHDRPRVRRRDLRRADHPRGRRDDHRQGAPGRDAARPSAGRPRSTPRWRCTSAASWRSTTSR